MRLLRPLFLFFALALLCVSGCRSRSGAGPAAQMLPAVTKPSPFDRIVRGTSAEEVLALVGKPNVITPIPHEDVTAETWLYLRKLDETVRQIPIGTREVPAINPLTGQSIIIQEPIMTERFTTLYEDFKLLVVDGHVAAIRRRQNVEQKVH